MAKSSNLGGRVKRMKGGSEVVGSDCCLKIPLQVCQLQMPAVCRQKVLLQEKRT